MIHSMTDLYLALACVLVLSAFLACGGVIFARRTPQWLGLVVMIVLIVGLIVFLRSNGDRLWLAGVVPGSALIVAGNVTLPAVALLCGMAFARMPGHPGRRLVLLVPLAALAGFDLVRPLYGHPPALGDAWKNAVCCQTSGDSCSPAAVATLLRAYGIAGNEKELAWLCLTRPGGTPPAGVYRALVLKTAGLPLRPEPFHCDLATLRRTLDRPVLLTVGLEAGATVDPRYEKQWGWAPGVRHTIVLFRFLANDRIEVGDPDAGREIWSLDSLKVLWHGNGIRLRGR